MPSVLKRTGLVAGITAGAVGLAYATERALAARLRHRDDPDAGSPLVPAFYDRLPILDHMPPPGEQVYDVQCISLHDQHVRVGPLLQASLGVELESGGRVQREGGNGREYVPFGCRRVADFTDAVGAPTENRSVYPQGAGVIQLEPALSGLSFLLTTQSIRLLLTFTSTAKNFWLTVSQRIMGSLRNPPLPKSVARVPVLITPPERL